MRARARAWPVGRGKATAAVDGELAVAERSRSRSLKTHDRQRHRERRRRRHHGARRLCARARADERRPRGDGRDLGRVDRHAHGNPRAAYRRARAGGKRSRAAGGTRGARAGGVRPEGSTSSSWPRPRTCSSRRRRPSSPTRSAPAGGRLRPPRRVHGLRLRLSQAYGQVATGLSRGSRRRRRGLSRITNWQDRSTCILFGDGAGAAVVSRSARAASASSSGRTARVGPTSACLRGFEAADLAGRLEDELQFIRMNGPGLPVRDPRYGQLG